MPSNFSKRLVGMNLQVFSREHSIILEETENMSKEKYLEAYEAFLDPYKNGAILAIEFYKSSFKRIIKYFETDADKLYPLFLINQTKLDDIIKCNIKNILSTLNDNNNEYMAKCITKWTLFFSKELLESITEDFLKKAANLSAESNFITLRCWFSLEDPHVTIFLKKFLEIEILMILVTRKDFFKKIDFILRFIRDVLLFSKNTEFFNEFIKQANTKNLIFELFLIESKPLMKSLMLDILTLMKDDDDFINLIHFSLLNNTLINIKRKLIPNMYELPTEDDLSILEIINNKFIDLQIKNIFNPFHLSFHMLLLVKMEMCFNNKIAKFFIEDFNTFIYLLLYSDIYSIELGTFYILKFLIINDLLELKHYSLLLKEMYKIGRRHYIEKSTPCPNILSKYSFICKLYELLKNIINENNEIIEFWDKELIKDTLFLDDFCRQRIFKDDIIDRGYVNYVFEELFSSIPKSKFFQSD